MRKSIYFLAAILIVGFAACSSGSDEIDTTVSVTGVTLNEETLSLIVGNTETLVAIVAPADATNKNVTWRSSDETVAKVDAEGVVTAVAAGTATITVTTEDGAKTAISDITVDGVRIEGVVWATRNVDAPGTFAENPQDAGMFYQWNRRTGWASTGYEWPSPMPGWNSTVPTGTMWYAENDPCPTGWRVPTQAELQSLYNAGSAWTTIDGVNGRLYGTAPNQIFLPATGWRWSNGGALDGVDESGNYWSSTQNDSTNVWGLSFHSSLSNISPLAFRSFGFNVRCVAE